MHTRRQTILLFVRMLCAYALCVCVCVCVCVCGWVCVCAWRVGGCALELYLPVHRHSCLCLGCPALKKGRPQDCTNLDVSLNGISAFTLALALALIFVLALLPLSGLFPWHTAGHKVKL